MSTADKMSRADIDFLKDLHLVKKKRIKNELEEGMISTAELQRMGRNSSVYPKWLEELSTIPRRLRNGK